LGLDVVVTACGKFVDTIDEIDDGTFFVRGCMGINLLG
jgi:hypothetical protein